MWVSDIGIVNFRNFEKLQIALENGVNIVYGDNANGKTNFIEAIYFCATGRSQRASHDSELIKFGCLESHMQLVVERPLIDFESDFKLKSHSKIKIDVHLGTSGKKKGIAINHIPIKKLSQLYGQLLVVIFTPEDMKMIKGGPKERRAFIDIELCQLSSVYCHALKQYHQALKQRNNLIKAIPKDRSLLDTLEVWDAPLCEYGPQIMAHRSGFIKDLENIAARIHGDITGGKEKLTLIYRPNITEPQQFKEKLSKSLERDIAIGNTSLGIHKDDVDFAINGNPIKIYGSQGQQRTASLSVKLAEIQLIKERAKQVPVLLLDDVLSELDENRQGFLFEQIKEIQTVITCTGIEDVLKKTTGNILKMVEGRIE